MTLLTASMITWRSLGRNSRIATSDTLILTHQYRSADDNARNNRRPWQLFFASVVPVAAGRNFSLFHLPGFPEDVPALSGLRPQVSAGRRIFSGRHVHQLWPGACHHRADRGAVVGYHRLVDHQRCDLGGGVVPAARSEHFTLRPRALDLSGPDFRSGASNRHEPRRGGRPRPPGRAQARLACFETKSGAALRRAEDASAPTRSATLSALRRVECAACGWRGTACS